MSCSVCCSFFYSIHLCAATRRSTLITTQSRSAASVTKWRALNLPFSAAANPSHQTEAGERGSRLILHSDQGRGSAALLTLCRNKSMSDYVWRCGVLHFTCWCPVLMLRLPTLDTDWFEDRPGAWFRLIIYNIRDWIWVLGLSWSSPDQLLSLE